MKPEKKGRVGNSLKARQAEGILNRERGIYSPLFILIISVFSFMHNSFEAKSAFLVGIFVVLSFFMRTHSCYAVDAVEELLTKEERVWLDNHKTIRIGVGISFPPYQWVDKVENKYIFNGVVSDYVKIIEKRLDIKMEVVWLFDVSSGFEDGVYGGCQ